MTLLMIQDEAMRLASGERIVLVEKLWDSLEAEAFSGRHQLWANEVESRIAAVESGQLSVVDGPSALQGLKQALQR